MKGISMQNNYPIGGIFQTGSYNFDPFDYMGYFRASVLPTQLDDTKITAITNSICAHTGSDSYVFALANRSGTGAKNLFRIKVSDQTVTNYSLTGGAATGANGFQGLISYKGRLVFVDTVTGAFWSVLDTGLTETYLGIAPSINVTYTPPVFHVAPDQNMYFTTGVSGGNVGKIDTVTGAGGNTDTAFTVNPDCTVKDFTSDGRYEIIISDNNPAKTPNINSLCNVHFWDMDSADADVVLEIPDAYLISARFVDGRLLVLGASGLWQCGIATSPRLIFPLSISQLPKNPYNVSVRNNILYWATQGTGAYVFAYGATVGKPILFNPHQTSTSDNLHTTFIASGSYFYADLDAGTNTTKMYVHNYGTDRANASVLTCPSELVQPFSFSFAKVTLKNKLTAGQEINLTVRNSEGLEVMANSSKTYTTDPDKRTFIFLPKVGTPPITRFEDLAITVNPVAGAVVQRVAIYGIPEDDNAQLI